jgi:hypothetical protein
MVPDIRGGLQDTRYVWWYTGYRIDRVLREVVNVIKLDYMHQICLVYHR